MKRLTECGCDSMNADHSNLQNYMFFNNLKVIKRMVDAMLTMSPEQIDQMLSDGHEWASDHIATSKDDVEEVAGFLMGSLSNNTSAGDAYNMQQPQFLPADFKNHLQNKMNERIEHRDGKWVVKPKKGDHVLGTHSTKKAALKQLAAIEIAKHKK
jgi:hypothetical protein